MHARIVCCAVALISLAIGVVRSDRYIQEINEGPYKKYSVQPLVELGNTFYYFESNLVANWYAANDFCRKLGLFLVSVETPEENKLIADYIISIGAANYWTSLTDLGSLNTYVWFTTGERALYTDWHVGQPDHAINGTERCGMYSYTTNVLKWADAVPTTNLHIICEQFPDPGFNFTSV